MSAQNPYFYISEDDRLPKLDAILIDGRGDIVDLTGATVEFHMATQAGTNVITADADIVDEDNGHVQYDWQFGDTADPGTYNATFRVTFPSGLKQTFPNDRFIEVRIQRKL